MLEFAIKNKAFKATKLDAFKQLHITKRLLPLLSGLSHELLNGDALLQDKAAIIALINALSQSLSSLKDEDLESVIKTALSVVSIKTGNNWTSVMRHQELMFDDLTLFELINITIEVIKDNLLDFFTELQENGSNILTTQA